MCLHRCSRFVRVAVNDRPQNPLMRPDCLTRDASAEPKMGRELALRRQSFALCDHAIGDVDEEDVHQLQVETHRIYRSNHRTSCGVNGTLLTQALTRKYDLATWRCASRTLRSPGPSSRLMPRLTLRGSASSMRWPGPGTASSSWDRSDSCLRTARSWAQRLPLEAWRFPARSSTKTSIGRRPTRKSSNDRGSPAASCARWAHRTSLPSIR